MNSKFIYSDCISFSPVAKKFSSHNPDIDGHTCDDRTPYTYFVAWVDEYGSIINKYYGVKSSKGCHPSLFWRQYKTSSEIVKRLVSELGNPSITEIRRVFSTTKAAVKWESTVLRRLDVIHSSSWLNKHYNCMFNTQETKSTNLRRYGTPCGLQNPEIQEKTVATLMELYGVDNAGKSTVIQDRMKETCLSVYGTEYALSSDIVKEKVKNTCIEKYGVPNVMLLEEVQEKSRDTYESRTGYRYPQQNPEVQEQTKLTNLERHGHSCTFQAPEIKAKCVETIKEKYDVEYVSQSPIIQEKIRDTYMEKHGVTHHNKTPEKREAMAQRRRDSHIEKLPLKNEIRRLIKLGAKPSHSKWWMLSKELLVDMIDEMTTSLL